MNLHQNLLLGYYLGFVAPHLGIAVISQTAELNLVSLCQPKLTGKLQKFAMLFSTINNPPEEVERPSQLRVDEETFPIDIREHLKNVKGYENIQEDWN
jgi:hypothetical protein